MVKSWVLLSGVAAVAAAAAPTVDLVDLASSVPALSTLVTAVVAGDLATTLKSEGPFTVFAPTNDAFGRLPAGTLDTLLKPENKAQLVDILTFHVLPRQVLSTDLPVLKDFRDLPRRVKTVEGKQLSVFLDRNGTVMVNAGLWCNEDYPVIAADNLATNGVAHIIGNVLLPNDSEDLVETLSGIPALSTLVAAVVAGDLATTLKSEGPFTVFAPTNDAFGALPAGTVDTLLKPENKAQLVDILTYHVLPSQVLLSTDLKAYQDVKTVEGKLLRIVNYGWGVFVGSPLTPPDMIEYMKQVTQANWMASNGVAHIINGVMLPPAKLEVGSDLKNLKQVADADNFATNGVAHIINGVMLPPAAEIQV